MDTTTPEEEETIDALLQPITSVYDLSPSKEYAPKKLSFLISTKKLEELCKNYYRISLVLEDIYLEKQKEYPQLASLQEFLEKFSKRLTSEEIYREVSKKNAALEKNS